jgi:bacteriorhodopsin
VFELTTLVVIGTDCTGSFKFNYHTITTTMALIVCVLVLYHIYKTVNEQLENINTP